MFKAKILADSILSTPSSRLITLELTYPRFVHSEFMTHRTHSRNSASSRAIPVSKMIEQVKENPVIPIHWGKNQKGMQAETELSIDVQNFCTIRWLAQRDRAVECVKELIENGLHKQIANRLLEPWMWITIITTAGIDGWNNFFALRCHPDAEPHIQKIAYLAKSAIQSSSPEYIINGWHLPLIGFDGDEKLSEIDAVKVSVGRCARVSYLTHFGTRDVAADIELHDRLQASKHFSPFEHVARRRYSNESEKLCGNFPLGWTQYRKTLCGEFQK